MSTAIEPILGEIRRMHEGNAWHGPAVLEALDGITASQAAARPIPGAHTIHELTHHIAAWIGEATARLRGNRAGEPADGNFPPQGTPVDDAVWDAARALLARRHAEFLETVSSFNPARLGDPVDPSVPAGDDGPRTFSALIHGVVQHNAYHAGQVMLLRRALEGSE